jgi:hypothetical protein
LHNLGTNKKARSELTGGLSKILLSFGINGESAAAWNVHDGDGFRDEEGRT